MQRIVAPSAYQGYESHTAWDAPFAYAQEKIMQEKQLQNDQRPFGQPPQRDHRGEYYRQQQRMQPQPFGPSGMAQAQMQGQSHQHGFVAQPLAHGIQQQRAVYQTPQSHASGAQLWQQPEQPQPFSRTPSSIGDKPPSPPQLSPTPSNSSDSDSSASRPKYVKLLRKEAKPQEPVPNPFFGLLDKPAAPTPIQAPIHRPKPAQSAQYAQSAQPLPTQPKRQFTAAEEAALMALSAQIAMFQAQK